MQQVIGKLVNVSGRFFYLVQEDGEALKIHFEGEGKLPPFEQKIGLSISDEPEYEDGGYSCVTEGKYWITIPELIPAASIPEKKHIGLYYQHWPGKDREKEQATAEEWALELERFYKLYSKKRWDVKVEARVSDSKRKATPPDYGLMGTDSFPSTVDFGDFKPNYHHVVSIYSEQTYCGLGNVNGNKSATYRYGQSCNEHTVIHELGHNFGLHHANDHEKGEYYDKTCVMGMGPSTPGLNGPHLLQLNVETDREKITINQSTQLLICPIEIPEYAMHDNEWQHVVLEKDGQDKIYVSMRKDKGWPWTPGKGSESTLYIHYRKDMKTWLWGTMGPNNIENPKRLPNGVKLYYHEYANETARVTFDYGDGVEVKEVAMPNGFPEIFTESELSEAHSGLWYDPDMKGQGFDLYVKNGRMVVYWYTYNVEENSRRFYYGEVNLEKGSEEFDLYTTHDGTFEDSTGAIVEKVGQGQLYFIGPENGVFNYRTTEHGRGSVTIVPIAKSQDQLSGLWYEKKPNIKTGFSAQFFPHLDKAILYWYTYGSKVKPTSPERKGYETQRWFYCDGTKVAEKGYDFKILEPIGGKFGVYGPPELVEVGVATLAIEGPNNLVFDYKIAADPSVTGEGTLNLQRLF